MKMAIYIKIVGIMMEVGKNIMDMTNYAQGERQLQLMRIFITLMKMDI